MHPHPQQADLGAIGSPLADFTEQARTLMAARGYSTRRLAREIPCDPSDLSKVLRGLKSPSPLIRQRMDVILAARGAIRDTEARTGSRPSVLRRRLTGADADAVLATLAAFRGIDNVNGGGHAYSLAAAYLDQSVTPMLREGSYSEADGRALFGAAAQVAHLAAWTAYDNGDARNAEKYLARALELAAAGGRRRFHG